MLYSHVSDKFNVPNPIASLPRPRIRHRLVKTLSLIEASLLDKTPGTLRERVAMDMSVTWLSTPEGKQAVR
ncbi:hypothetical protein ACFLUZ_06865 [Chloroflexota bacterium]